ncbi:TIGR02530 family flagellar biosynthesis protein [Bacillus sp. 2205SS5-2]|uniref:TIGR02530 family flagellar biosynthesis protein n=1 Tax=Bacillus sp. 2205SS5-2 TaxID=3109031 RepID=UPI003003F258
MDKRYLHTQSTQPALRHHSTKNILSTKVEIPFSDHLQAAIQPKTSLTLSKHANQRLERRDIQISSSEWKDIEDKVALAKSKGVNESLVILQNAALVVSAKNETVITAMSRQEATAQIFTNIDGAIVLNQ